MKTFLYSQFHRGWMVLMAATVLGYTVRIEASIGLIAGITTLLIAYLKARVVLLDFMEFRHAPRAWRAMLEGWLALLSLFILAVYGSSVLTD